VHHPVPKSTHCRLRGAIPPSLDPTTHQHTPQIYQQRTCALQLGSHPVLYCPMPVLGAIFSRDKRLWRRYGTCQKAKKCSRST